MFQTCQHCSYESPAGARFCRQCGAPLFAETEASAASTRNYGRQESAPPVAAPASGHLPPSVADIVAGETERYYQAPYVPAPLAPATAPIKSRRRRWRFILLAFVLLFGVMFSVMIGIEMADDERPVMTPEARAEQEARRRQEDRQRETEDRIRESQDRVREAMDRQREALDRARESAERAAEAGGALALTDEKPLDFSQYEYPGATVGSSIRIPGHEMLTMRVPDGHYDAVNQFFQKKLGKPVIQINEQWEKRLLFQSNTTPPISVSVETDYNPAGQLKITVLRSPFRVLSADETQNSK